MKNWKKEQFYFQIKKIFMSVRFRQTFYFLHSTIFFEKRKHLIFQKGSVNLITNYYEKDKLLVFKINEEIDECSVKNIRRKADYEIERFMPREVVFDFDSVTFMDSAGIGMVIGRFKQAQMLRRKDRSCKLK